MGWLTVLKMVSWTDVISNAPKVADGAKKLWGSVGKKPPVKEIPAVAADTTVAPDAPSVVRLAARVAVLEEASRDLHSQMLASSELINTLAEQNTQLVARVERNRRQLMALLGLSVVSVIASAVTLLMVLR